MNTKPRRGDDTPTNHHKIRNVDGVYRCAVKDGFESRSLTDVAWHAVTNQNTIVEEPRR